MGKAEFDKAVNSLLGLVEGVAIDGKINQKEADFLQLWVDDHRIHARKHPFTELFPVVVQAIADGVLSDEERADITWLCRRLISAEYFDSVTADMQRLHAILAGVVSDGEISVDELRGMSAWLREHEHLERCWPYDEVRALVTGVLADQRIDADEHKKLLDFFGEFVTVLDHKTILAPLEKKESSVQGVCAITPKISFEGGVFCLTGESVRFVRSDFEALIYDLGGSVSKTVTRTVNYLVVGANGNPCWAYACYGRKVEKAMELRRGGHSIMLVHENDFHDAVADLE